jgi:hypothetical protein
LAEIIEGYFPWPVAPETFGAVRSQTSTRKVFTAIGGDLSPEVFHAPNSIGDVLLSRNVYRIY